MGVGECEDVYIRYLATMAIVLTLLKGRYLHVEHILEIVGVGGWVWVSLFRPHTHTHTHTQPCTITQQRSDHVFVLHVHEEKLD